MAPGNSFPALLLRETDAGVVPAIEELTTDDLPEGDVVVDVEYSTLNYKDGMAIRGLGRVVRFYPFVPGIDLAGVVSQSASPDYAPGDRVVLTGWGLGERHWGGYARRARVPAGWLVPLPDGLTTKHAMAIGTAGYTAMLGLLALEAHGLTPETEGEVLVTGAAGGVGSVAVALFSALGYRVVAGTGRAETHDYLKALGATETISRAELETSSKGPLTSERWAAAIDNAGGVILSNLLAALRRGGACASIGLAASPEFTATVIPFLLRGVSLLGINCNALDKEGRITAWGRLARDLPMDRLDSITTTASLADLPDLADEILAGRVRGRTVIAL